MCVHTQRELHTIEGLRCMCNMCSLTLQLHALQTCGLYAAISATTVSECATLLLFCLCWLAVCPPGTVAGTGGQCDPCPAGSVCPGSDANGTIIPPFQCPDHMTSSPGSDSVADCVCNPGYGMWTTQALPQCLLVSK